MSASEDIKDQAVAVHLARIEEKMEGLKAFNNSMAEQLKSLANEVREISNTSQLYGTHNDSIKRIWEEIEKRDAKWDARLSNLDTAHGNTRERVNRIFWFSAGAGSLASILLGLILWVVSGEMQKSNRLDQRLDSVELHLAGDQVRPYKPR